MGVAENLEKVNAQLAKAAADCGRIPSEVCLVAVSKCQPIEKILQAYEAGQRIFGESRIQEIEEKRHRLPSDIQWHLIGHLQSNKASRAIEIFSVIHSVDSAKLLGRIGQLSASAKRKTTVLLEVNVSG